MCVVCDCVCMCVCVCVCVCVHANAQFGLGVGTCLCNRPCKGVALLHFVSIVLPYVNRPSGLPKTIESDHTFAIEK